MTNGGRVPLVVDLDGTLIRTDLLAETASQFVLGSPSNAFKLFRWLLAGIPVLKANLAICDPIDVAELPYNESLLEWLKAEKSKGRLLVLATASHQCLADQIAKYLGLFDEVWATKGDTNLKAAAKRDLLVDKYGETGFDYVGNDWADIVVWRSAAVAHVVSHSARLIQKVREHGNLGIVFSDRSVPFGSALICAIRPHQWVKNFLVLVPLLAAHRYGFAIDVWHAILAFLVFCITASSVYLLNDLIDVSDDRHHESKRRRPFASGHIGVGIGWLIWPFILAVACLVARQWLNCQFLLILVTYYVLTLAYSLRLKRMPVVDVLTLAGLYTLRIVAGAAAIEISVSFWLLLFSGFLFLSLAFIKRYSELHVARSKGPSTLLRGRGYEAGDLEFVSSLGGNAGYIAVLVLALYIQDSHTAELYATPSIIWFACPLLLFWISRVWLIAHRGLMNEDPIVFALKDWISWLVVALFFLVIVLAKVIQ